MLIACFIYATNKRAHNSQTETVTVNRNIDWEEYIFMKEKNRNPTEHLVR